MASLPGSRPLSPPLATAPSSQHHSPKATASPTAANSRPRSAVERIIEKGMGLSKVTPLVLVLYINTLLLRRVWVCRR